MKTVYFVRHGETEGNAGKIFQGSDTPLNAQGREQAVIVAERCAKLPVDVMIASSMKRAQETAQIISERIGKPFETSPLFTEARRPLALEGRSASDPEAAKMQEGWVQGYLGDGPRIGEGETFDDLRTRAGLALQFLDDHPADNILIVTHGLFLRILYARVVFGENLTAAECKQILFSLKSDNTGITMFVHGQRMESKEIGWGMRVWNDHAHLG